MAETEMIARVARAIARKQSGSLFREECTPAQLDAFGYMEAARAAIEAMRELEGAPLMAAYKAACRCGGAINTDEITKVWQDAIDAALNEQVAV